MQDASQISVESYKAALSALWSEEKIPENHMLMLITHYRAPQRIITTSELAEAVGYKSYRGVNLQYGKLAYRVSKRVGYTPPEGWVYLHTLVIFENDKTPFKLRLRPNLATALEELGWVRID